MEGCFLTSLLVDSVPLVFEEVVYLLNNRPCFSLTIVSIHGGMVLFNRGLLTHLVLVSLEQCASIRMSRSHSASKASVARPRSGSHPVLQASGSLGSGSRGGSSRSDLDKVLPANSAASRDKSEIDWEGSAIGGSVASKYALTEASKYHSAKASAT
jgi:hypothetical protein